MPERLNTYLFVSLLSMTFIIFSIIHNVSYINYGFVTFLYSYLAYFANIFFTKGMNQTDDGKRMPEFAVQIGLLVLWLSALVYLLV